MGPPKGPLGTDMTLVSMKTSDRLATLQRLRDLLAEAAGNSDAFP